MEAAPFASWARAQTAAAPGDTAYCLGGVHRYTNATSTCTSGTAAVEAIVLSKSGTAGRAKVAPMVRDFAPILSNEGWARRVPRVPKQLGVDEKSIRKGSRFATIAANRSSSGTLQRPMASQAMPSSPLRLPQYVTSSFHTCV